MTAYGIIRTGTDCTGATIHSEAGNRKLRQLRQRLRLPAAGLRMPHAGNLLHEQRHVPVLPGSGSAEQSGAGSSLAGDAYKTMPALWKALPGQWAESVLLR